MCRSDSPKSLQMCTYVAVLGQGPAHGAADSADGRRHFFLVQLRRKADCQTASRSTLSEARCRRPLANIWNLSKSAFFFAALNSHVSRCDVSSEDTPLGSCPGKLRAVCFLHQPVSSCSVKSRPPVHPTAEVNLKTPLLSKPVSIVMFYCYGCYAV